MITIYSKPDCIYCAKAKAFMTKHHIEYKEFLMGRDITREEILEQFPQMKTMPIILNEGGLIGGYTNLLEHYEGIV